MGWALSEEERLRALESAERALVTGTDIVKYADKSIKYRSVEAIQQVIQLLRASLGMTKAQQSGRPNQVRPTNDDGW